MSPRVVIDARKLGDGGIGVYTKNLINSLYDSGLFELALITESKKTNYIQSKWKDVEVIEDNSKKYSLSEYFLMSLKHRKKLKNSILHFPHYTVPFFLPKSSIITCTIHDCIHLSSNNFLKRIFSKYAISHALKRSTQVLTVSDYSKNQILNYFNTDHNKIKNVSNYIEPALEEVSSSNAKHYLCITNDMQHKGLSILLDTWQNSKEFNQGDRKLLVLGSKKKSEIKNITFKQHCSEAELKKLYENAKALIIPSLEEGFGIPALEALKIGIPVVSFPLSSFVENFSDSIWYADKFCFKELFNAIKQMEEQDEKRKSKIELGKKIARNFSKESFSNKILSVFKTLNQTDDIRRKAA